MNFFIKVKPAKIGGFYATIDFTKGDAKEVKGSPAGIVYSDSAGEAYEIFKKRLEAKGHSVIEEE